MPEISWTLLRPRTHPPVCVKTTFSQHMSKRMHLLIAACAIGLLLASCTTSNGPSGALILKAGDVISIKYTHDPQLNESNLVIGPDGLITIQAIGDVLAAGLTPSALAKKIEDLFLEANIFTRSGSRRGEARKYHLVTVHVEAVSKPSWFSWLWQKKLEQYPTQSWGRDFDQVHTRSPIK